LNKKTSQNQPKIEGRKKAAFFLSRGKKDGGGGPDIKKMGKKGESWKPGGQICRWAKGASVSRCQEER